MGIIGNFQLNSLITKDYNFFLGRIYFTSNDGSKNISLSINTWCFNSQITKELKKDKGTDFVLSCESKGVSNSGLKSLYTAFLNSIKLYWYRIGINFDKDPLAVEQNNYLSKIVNAYIVYDSMI